jgi:hypothetical protein
MTQTKQLNKKVELNQKLISLKKILESFIK